MRARLGFRGIIQGVGFRPTVYRVAAALGLAGWVQNRRSEVVAEIQGPADAVDAFLPALRRALPPAARLDAVLEERIPDIPEAGFAIRASGGADWQFPPIPPDLALCADCRRELLDPADRRFLYPFISCTQCGPRYSIVERTPFDRETTSMADFPLCPRCRAEYEDPRDRRFHAQTTCCPDCGPRLSLLDAGGRPVAGDPLLRAIEALAEGRIVAVQGIGGFHLAADPSGRESGECIRRLRQDKERERKPFALMAADLEAVRELCECDEGSARALASHRAPIVILPAREPDRLLAVSDTGTLGVMLPYTPLHLLLFAHPRAPAPFRWLVMTSGNLKGEPIVTGQAEALAKLGGIADLFLCHDRRILFRTDDSILRPALSAAAGSHLPFVQLRRSRGFVPELVALPRGLERPVLAVGGDLKSAPAMGRGTEISLSPFVGDLEDPETMRAFERQLEGLLGLYQLEPGAVLYDPHPRYRSCQWALASRFAPKVPVQHHHAHLLSVMAEHGLEDAIGLSFDGTGFGADGTIWGGEFLRARRDGFERLGLFGPFPLPGGDAAVLHPLRIAAAVFLHGAAPMDRLLPEVPGDERRMLARMVERGLNAPMSSSLGRVFDAAAALLGLVRETSYEGEGPIRLEGLAISAWRARRPPDAGARGLVPLAPGSPFRLDVLPLLRHLAEARDREAPASLALMFHVEVADAALAGAVEMRRVTGVSALALSGGVFQNTLLRELLLPRLAEAGFTVYLNERVPPGDGGLAVGQAWFRF